MPGYSDNVILVNEIWDQICSYLTHQNLANLRLACRRFNEIALPRQYRSLRLEAFGDSVHRFVDIAKSPRLHRLVRTITIDTHVDFDFEYTGGYTYPFPQAFMEALPHLRYFTNITSLHIRFEEHCSKDEEYGYSSEEVAELRYRVLDTIMHCAAGMWTLEKQRIIDKVLLGYLYVEDEMEEFDYSDQDLKFMNEGPFPLRELTVTNLADNDDANLTLSEAWKAVISLPSLVDLKLLVATEEDQYSPERSIYLENKYYFFQSLHETWLSPNLSQHLRVLSLYFQDYWGWFPKMDFRLIGEDSPFPHLKVLALGNYVFSHRWQIEWFAKIGKENSSGGLEELYLDDCPILYKARQNGPLHDGYPDFVSILEDRDNANPSTHTFSLRWHEVFSQWKNSMTGLRVLKMGSGSWVIAPMCTYHTMLCDSEYGKLSIDVLRHRTSHNIHRDFACPAPIPRCNYWEPKYRKIFASGKYLNGEGISDTRDRRMQYIEYDIGVGPTAWCEQTNIAAYDGYEPEEGTLMKDDQAWDEIVAACQVRQAA